MRKLGSLPPSYRFVLFIQTTYYLFTVNFIRKTKLFTIRKCINILLLNRWV